ncbi:MAG TPA: sugar O-acetyltransferase [Candidatus Methanomethylophilaceae archaeon]|nr:sugar O-acetyltransferase [Candidatus Methanomethylophilaceae archaeon]
MQNKFSSDSFFGKVYAGKEVNNDDPGFGEFLEALENARSICIEYNESKYRTPDELREILRKLLLCNIDKETVIYPPFRCDIGFNIKLGKNVLINSNCFFLDSNMITIGDFVMIGPNVTIVTPNHSRDPVKRRRVGTISKPVVIEDDVWIGAGATILPGVTIGAGAIVGAGSIVTRDVPAGKTVGGNPARIIGEK